MAGISRRLLLAAPAVLAVNPLRAESAGTLTLVVPFPPGGSTDALARVLQAGLQSRLGRVVVVENRSGAAGALGAAQVAKAAPDGSSLLVTFDSHAVIPAILDKPPLDVEKDLVPVFWVGTAPYVIAASTAVPFKSFADVIAAAKDKPGSVRYASVGIGTLGHLAMTVLGKKAGVEFTHIPYRGGGPAMNDLLGGHVDLIAGSAALVTPQLETGRILPLMQLGKERLPTLKDTPTAIESGFPGFEALAWWGVFAPAATAADILATQTKAIADTLNEPSVAAKLRETQQMTLVLGDAKTFAPFFAQQVKFWGDVVRENNIRA